jgi:hypothetical protein
VVGFGKRRKVLALHMLAGKKHQIVRQSLYVPLPVFVAVSRTGTSPTADSQLTKGLQMPKETEQYRT